MSSSPRQVGILFAASPSAVLAHMDGSFSRFSNMLHSNVLGLSSMLIGMDRLLSMPVTSFLIVDIPMTFVLYLEAA